MVATLKTTSPLNEITRFLDNPPPRFLSVEEAAAYALSLLLEKPSYAYGMMEAIANSSNLRISDTVMFKALKSLEDAGVIYQLETVKKEGRGRPPQNYAIADGYRAVALKVVARWQKYMEAINV